MDSGMVAVLLSCTDPGGGETKDTAGSDSPETTTPTDTADTTTTDSPTPPGPVNLLLVTIDTLRWDRPENMPWLGELAGSGLVLGNTWGQSWTYPGMGTVLTGQPPNAWGAGSWTTGGSALYVLAEAIPTLAERLAPTHASYLASGNDFVSPGAGVGRGYDVSVVESDALVVDHAPALLDWVAAQKSPWFAHLHVMEPHAPYDDAAESCRVELEEAAASRCRYDVTTDNAEALLQAALISGDLTTTSADYAACLSALTTAYDCGVRYADDVLRSALWDELDAGGHLADTLVVVTTDHGEGLLDPTVSHGFDSRAPVTRGFTVFLGSPRLSPGILETITGQVDIVPTILDLLDLPTDPALPGRSVLGSAEDRVLTSFYCGIDASGQMGHTHGAVGEGYHYLSWQRGRETQLFDLAADPGELTNLAGAVAVPSLLLGAVAAQEIETADYCSLP